MCGIAGIVTPGRYEGIAQALTRMSAAIRHRGPDADGDWSGVVGARTVALGFRRLAIIDLSDAGQQPMFLPDRSHGVVFNGEIYNYVELREELAALGASFRTQSDTEVILWALSLWGEAAFDRFNGMWAIAWLDQSAQRLILSRDRFGEKPLYYYRDNDDQLFFASEIKAILIGTGRRFAVNPIVVGRYLGQSLLDAQDETFFAEIRALPAGHNLHFDLKNGRLDATPQPYWSFASDRVRRPITDQIAEVRETFLDAVRIRLRSDVPVGILLSGGVDSSAIAAAMRHALGRDADLHAMSATSEDRRYDESPFVEQVARHLRCPIHYVKLVQDAARWFELLDQVTYSNDEPIGSFSTVAHFLLMERARELGITVVLSGQGADELLCGYLKFLGFHLNGLVRRGHPLAALGTFASFVRRGTVVRQFELSEAKRYMPRFVRPREIDIRGPALQESDSRLDVSLGAGDLEARQRADLLRFSVPALTHYEDRSSMAWAREIRLPFLDARLINLILPLAPELKLREGWTKWILRKALEDLLPAPIIWRKDKQGFINPQSEWLKHELKPQVETMLAGEMLTARRGLIDQAALRRRYAAYQRQRPDRGRISFKDIFNPIVTEIWARQFADHLAAA
jgi:asparagine synthase (glutamine-hydrolysing)